MPLYPHRCSKCNREVEVVAEIKDRNKRQTCPSCGRKMKRLVVVRFYDEVWGPITLDHIADEPMTFTSKKQLRDECNKRHVDSSALL